MRRSLTMASRVAFKVVRIGLRGACLYRLPTDATRISFGVRLWNSGVVHARRIRIEIGSVLDPDTPLEASAAAELQSAIDIVRKNGLRRDRVSWPALERQVRTLASGAMKPSDVYPAIGLLLAEAADRNHSMLLSPLQWTGMMTAGAEAPLPGARELEHAIGYINLPEHNTDQEARNREYVRRAHQLIEQIMPRAPCAWIIDVRTNGGGNVYPMLAALKPFLGNESLGSNVGPNGPGPPRVAGQNSEIVPPATLAALETAWVAVLIGPSTISAGERVAISFRGRVRTRLFGQPTQGMTTANETFDLPDGAKLVVTVSVMADRTGRTYGGTVEPDELVSNASTGVDGTRPDNDPVLRAAVQWLGQNSGCRAQQQP